jgi:hypothetical protein
MGNQSSIPVASLRRKVREALNLAPGYGKSESMLHELVNDLTGSPVSLQQLRDAREWNHEQGYIRSEDDDASDQILWYITKSGIAQQKI